MKIFGYEPAMILYSINSLIALLVSFGLDLTQVQVAAASTIATGVLAAITAILTRPFIVSVLTGAVTTVLTAGVAFGLHLSGDQIGTAVTMLSVVLALVLRANVSPAGAVQPGAFKLAGRER